MPNAETDTFIEVQHLARSAAGRVEYSARPAEFSSQGIFGLLFCRQPRQEGRGYESYTIFASVSDTTDREVPVPLHL